jgi:tRNA threonylcarbamoyladenosine biosynthesis protein TsaB
VPIILNIETSTTNCSVSLSDANETICLIEENFEQFSHSKSLHVFIDQILKRSKIMPKDLSAISISEGPGSYTGLRIGVSAAKGLCFGLGIPLISIDTLFILSRKIECSEGYIISALDARRNEIYYSILKTNKCKLPKKITEPDSLELSKDSFEKYLNKDAINFVGNSNEKIKSLIEGHN